MSHLIPLPASAVLADEPFVRPFPGSFPVPLRDAVSVSRRRHRKLIAAAGRWALARGLSLPADHVALWAAATEETGCAVGLLDTGTGPWRAADVPDFLATIASWCTRVGCAVPAHLTESLWHLFGFLADTSRLRPGSDSLHELRAAVVVFAGYDAFRPIPSSPPERTAA